MRLPANKELTTGELQAIVGLLHAKIKEVMAQGILTSRTYEELTAMYTLECAICDQLNDESIKEPLTLARLSSPDWVKDYFDENIAPHIELTQLPTESLKI